MGWECTMQMLTLNLHVDGKTLQKDATCEDQFLDGK
jgi:hypothetical protein